MQNGRSSIVIGLIACYAPQANKGRPLAAKAGPPRNMFCSGPSCALEFRRSFARQRFVGPSAVDGKISSNTFGSNSEHQSLD